MTVAVIGPDGAGKTTLVDGLRDAIPLPTRVLYMGLTGGMLRYVRRIRVPGVHFVLLAAVLWGRYLRGQAAKLRGRLVIYDRYIYDAAAPHPDRLTKIQLLSRRLSGYVCPGPDRVFLLDAPGALMFARKGEYSAAMLEDWRWHFHTLQRRLRRIDVLDASEPADVVRSMATRRIWEEYARRWR